MTPPCGCTLTPVWTDLYQRILGYEDLLSASDIESVLRHSAASRYWVISILLLIPPVFTTFRRFSFESQRWRESDYAPSGSSSDD